MTLVFLIEKHRALTVVVDDEEWTFQLFEHVYSDQSTTTAEINAAQTRTTIEISLLKQQPRTIWPQLHSYNSTPRTPQRPDPKTSSSISTLPVYQLSTKKLSSAFSETTDTARWFLTVPQVSSCQVQFNETNFTITFQTRLAKAFLSQWNFPIVLLLVTRSFSKNMVYHPQHS